MKGSQVEVLHFDRTINLACVRERGTPSTNGAEAPPDILSTARQSTNSPSTRPVRVTVETSVRT